MLPQGVPFSTISILIIAALISFLTSFINRLLTDPEKSKAWRKEIAEWNAALREARRSGDRKSIEKLMKRHPYIMQLQSKMMWQSAKASLLFFIPFLIIWRVLDAAYAGSHIAYFPGVGPVIQLPLIGPVASLYWWYILCSILFSTAFSRLLGLMSVE